MTAPTAAQLDMMDKLAEQFQTIGLPLDALDTMFLTENEREAFYRTCRARNVRHTSEIRAAPVEPMDSAALARANID